MSGESVGYHLRYNKYVERRIFSELLLRIHRFVDISEYTYIGFGGVFLEDFKAMHSDFGIRKMLSIEALYHIQQRQDFNKPLSCITCLHTTSGKFVTDYSSTEDNNVIVWLDYASPKEIKSQILESESLISKLKAFDIFKVTFNCSEKTLYDSSGSESAAIKHQKRWNKLKGRIQDLFRTVEDEFEAKDLTREGYPKIILRLLQDAIGRAMRHSTDLEFLPLSNIVYSDSQHQMLTMSGIIIPKSEKDAFLSALRLDRWDYFIGGWKDYSRVDVPTLTSKEKLIIDSQLPAGDQIDFSTLLPFQIAENSEETELLLKNYIRLYRHYPNFLRVVL